MGVLITKEVHPQTKLVHNNSEPVVILKSDTASITGGAEFKNGVIQKWTSTSIQLTWEINFKHTGPIEFSINLANNRLNSGAIIKLQIGSAKATGKTYFSGGWQNFENMALNTITTTQIGPQLVVLRAVDLNNTSVGLLSHLILVGPGVKDAKEIVSDPRTGFVGLQWKMGKDYEGLNWIYNSVNVTEDVHGTAYIVCSFNDGQFILLSNVEDGTKYVSFIVYSVEHGTQFENCVSKQVIPTLIQKQKKVVSGISKQSSGHYSHLKYQWFVGQTYHFLIKVDVVSYGIEYAAFFYLNETSEWKKMAVYRVRHEIAQPRFMTNAMNCRVQAFCDRSARFARRVVFGPTWCKKYGGDWMQVKEFVFICEDIEDMYANAGLKDGNKMAVTAWGKSTKEKTEAETGFKCQTCKLPAVLDVLPE